MLPVPLDYPVSDLRGRVAVEGVGPTGLPAVTLLEVQPQADDAYQVRFASLSGQDGAAHDVVVPAETTVGELIHGVLHLEPRTVGEIPDRVDPDKPKAELWPFLIAATGIAVGLIASMPVVIAASFIPLLYGLWTHLPRTVEGQRVVLTPREIEEQLRELPAIEQDRPVDLPTLTPLERADHVRATYGQLLTDVVYRIENPALFDAAVPTTQAFELALLLWNQDASDAAALASELESSFEAARRHAEAVGLDHLPEHARPVAERAVKAATTALTSGNEAERAVAREQAAKLLNSLALYYLPPIDPSAPALIGERKAIGPGL